MRSKFQRGLRSDELPDHPVQSDTITTKADTVRSILHLVFDGTPSLSAVPESLGSFWVHLGLDTDIRFSILSHLIIRQLHANEAVDTDRS